MKGNKELIQRWIDKADRDLSTAKLIYLHLPDYYEMIAFHCQQYKKRTLMCLEDFRLRASIKYDN